MPALGEVDQLQPAADLRIFDLFDVRNDLQVFHGAQVGVEVGRFEQSADVHPLVAFVAVVEPAVSAAVGANDTEDGAEGRGFTAAVRAEDAKNYPGVYFQRQVVDRSDITVVFGEVLNGKNWHFLIRYFDLKNQDVPKGKFRRVASHAFLRQTAFLKR